MKPFFCAVAAQAAQAPLIGTAGTGHTYVFIECPYPWASKAQESAALPLRLRNLMQAYHQQRKVRFFLILPEKVSKNTKNARRSRILTYQHQSGIFINGYVGQEFTVTSLAQAAETLEGYFNGRIVGQPIDADDLFVCVHGSRDKCCARFGRPFLKQAAKQLEQHTRPSAPRQLRLWQVSHIGGHRFAPTALHLPDGRWYGHLDSAAFQSLLARCGVLPPTQFKSQDLVRTYRGWGILPPELQVLERDLMQAQSLGWFKNRVVYRLQAVQKNEQTQVTTTQATLSVLSPDGQLVVYQASVTQSPAQQLRLSCEMAHPTDGYAYAVQHCYPLTTTARVA